MNRLTQPFQTGITLAIVALLSTTMLGLVHWSTKNQIQNSQQQQLVSRLNQIIPPNLYDNDLLTDTLQVTDSALGALAPQTVWRARKNGNPVAAILTVTAPNGYAGPITLLIGVLVNGEILSARVLTHRETPGLGDDIEISRSDWIHGFNRQSLFKLTAEQWRVKKDGGVFDQFTGATITPRAITSAIHSALNYYRQYQEILFVQAEH